MAKPKKNNKKQQGISDRQAVQQPSSFDHEFANEPLTENEKQNNKK
ncbi:small acid-soluble spore protein O [Pseudalkalibacillus sp. A8]